MIYHIVAERPQDAALLDPLLDRTFGPDRYQKTVYRLRDGLAPAPGLAFSALGLGGLLCPVFIWWLRRLPEARRMAGGLR